MKSSDRNLTDRTPWSIVLIVGIITLVTAVAWPNYVYPCQSHDLQNTPLSAAAGMTDEEIVKAISTKAAVDGIAITDVQTFSTNGIVTLDGNVPSLADREHLRRIASGVRGVRSVVNQLSVQASGLTDEQLRRAVNDQLSINTATDAYEVSVSVSDGKATLGGKVDSLAEKFLAEQVASGVRGVRAVDNQIEVNPPAHRPDSEVQADIIARIKNDVWIDEQLLAVEVDDGVVRFQGKVATSDQKDRLGILALTAGVRSVSSDKVQVDPSLTIVPKKRQPSTRLDFEIREALMHSIRLDPRVDLRELDMQVQTGIVVLEGTVGNLQSKRAAVDTASNVAGVTNVIDKLEISNEGSVPESTIRNRLKESFDRTATLKYDGIRVHVENGIVKLSGTVPSQYQRRRAAAIAHSLAGVLEVNNQISIDNPLSDRSDFDIALDIERGMRWSPYLNITKLECVVAEGVVTFSGTVANQQILDLARAIAIDAGARDIIATDVLIE